MKLNPAKNGFKVALGEFLGFMVNSRGIEANPTKIKAILELKSPEKVKEIQKLTRMIVNLLRCCSRKNS